MGWRIVKQPNDLLACFSETVDNFTAYDMSREEAITYCIGAGMHREYAEAKVQAGIDDRPHEDFLEASGLNDGLDRWRDCLETILWQHGTDELRRTLNMFAGG